MNEIRKTDLTEKKNVSIPSTGKIKSLTAGIKRITIATRHLYKGGFAEEFRNKVDVDHIILFSKINKNRI